VKRIIVLALGCLAMLSVGAAGAYFTAQAQVPENVIKAGSVAISTEATTAAISVDSLAPGCVATKTLTVTNDGALPSSVVVSAQKKAGYTDMYEALTCRVATADGEVYDGPMSALKTQAVRIDPGQHVEFQFGMGLPAATSNSLAGEYAKLTLYIDAEQVH